MSASLAPTVAATPTATSVATNLLATMAALNGQATDYNPGSQIRTLAEALGAIVEAEGIAGQALALQALAYGAMSLFGVQRAQALSAMGTVIFATSMPLSAAPNAPQAVAIPSGTLVQTAGGIQYATIVGAVLASGTPSVSVGVLATTPGVVGNVPSGAVTGTPLTSLGYPLFVTNGAPIAGGADAGTQSSTLAVFTAKVASLGLASPVAIANASIGITPPGSTETVKYAACVEPWLLAGSGAGSGTAGFTLYVDNGTGTASSGLINAVQNWITGSGTNQSGFRPAGVPYTVSGVTPVYAAVTVNGLLTPGLLATGSVSTLVTSSIQTYFDSLGISPVAAYQPQVAARAADAGLSAFQSITVNLYYSGSVTPVPLVSGSVGTRVILSSLSVNIGMGA